MTAIQWLEWGKAAFEKAGKEQKPVLLDIYGSWCHWCNQMDGGTYSDPEVARWINEKFIPVRVDTDKRPDINERYNQGGWPSAVFLAADGKIITGATYLTPTKMTELLHQVSEYHSMNEGEVGDDRIIVEKAEEKGHFGISSRISADVLEDMFAGFDINHGGFGYEPKFPLTDATGFLMLAYRKSRDVKLLRMLESTLDGIIGSGKSGVVTGLADNEEGGFFRYSVSRDWSLPHYEKMLETNAGMLSALLDAHAITKDKKYRRAAEKTVDYIESNLTSPEGGFYGSQHAGAEDDYYGRRLAERKQTTAPEIDKTIYTSWSAMAISAFLKAWRILGAESCKAAALKSLGFLLENCYDEKLGMFHYIDSNGKALSGLAADNIYTLEALLNAYEATADKKYLGYAEKLAKLAKKMEDKCGGFFDKMHDEEDIGCLKMPRKPLDENAVIAECFLKLGTLLANDEYRKTAEKTLEAFASDYRRYGIHAARYAAAIEVFMDTIEIIAVGTDASLLLSASADSRMIVQQLAEGDELAKKKGYKQKGIYVCRRHECLQFASAEEALSWLNEK